MRSMFWRLFLSFWLTMILGGFVSFIVISTFRNPSIQLLRDDMSRKMDENLSKVIVLSGQAALQMYRCGGKDEYDAFVGDLRDGAGIEIQLVGTDNRTITGEPLQGKQIQLVEKARKEHRIFQEKTAITLTIAKEIAVKDGDTSVVIGAHAFGPPPGMRPPGRGEPPFFSRMLPPFFGPGEVIRTVIMMIMVSVVCYLLARSLVIPIRRLQKIAQQITGGDYSARVGNSLGQAGNEIADLGRDFDVMVDRTETVINSQKRLLRDISHELRSPLARLNVALELAKKRLDGEHDSALAKIGQEADRLNQLIGHLLILSRLESGVGPMITEHVDLAALLREVAADADFEASLSSRGVALVAVAEVTVAGSRELLLRAIENIVRNAARYTAPDTQVEIVLAIREGKALISISDYGPGVPEKDLAHLFEPFYRVAKARERGSGGVGIGLAIAMQAVKAHGGTVVVKNAGHPHGLEVTITLPLTA
ncbi:MAG: ATP-binding protein [Pseudomonadota bacterium]